MAEQPRGLGTLRRLEPFTTSPGSTAARPSTASISTHSWAASARRSRGDVLAIRDSLYTDRYASADVNPVTSSTYHDIVVVTQTLHLLPEDEVALVRPAAARCSTRRRA